MTQPSIKRIGLCLLLTACALTAGCREKETAPPPATGPSQLRIPKEIYQSPGKDSDAGQVDALIIKSAGDGLNFYARMYATAHNGKQPASFNDFVTASKTAPDKTTVRLLDLSLDPCTITADKISCPENAFATQNVTYVLDHGSVQTLARDKD